MAGLVPAIHVLFAADHKKDVDAGAISAFTRVFDALCAGMTSQRKCRHSMLTLRASLDAPRYP